MEESKNAFKQNLINDFKIIGSDLRRYKHEVLRRPFTSAVATIVGVTGGIILGKVVFVPIMRVVWDMEENMKNVNVPKMRMEEKTKNMKVGNRKTDA